jgi:hypothetical protein
MMLPLKPRGNAITPLAVPLRLPEKGASPGNAHMVLKTFQQPRNSMTTEE